MAPRPYWKGYLKLSLVSCAVALYPASSRSDRISFHWLNRETGNRLRQQMIDAETGEPVDREERVRGYQLAKNDYLMIEEEDIDAVEIESSHTIDIERFVPRNEIRCRLSGKFSLSRAGRQGCRGSICRHSRGDGGRRCGWNWPGGDCAPRKAAWFYSPGEKASSRPCCITITKFARIAPISKASGTPKFPRRCWILPSTSSDRRWGISIFRNLRIATKMRLSK